MSSRYPQRRVARVSLLAVSAMLAWQAASAASDVDALQGSASVDDVEVAAHASTEDALAQHAAKALGDADRDLVFVPITPCRIFDSRVAGGQVAAGTVRGIDVTAVSSYAFQGGVNNDCGGMGNAGSFAAVAVNLIVVTPTANGYITAFPINTTMPVTSTVNYSAAGLVDNATVVRLDQGAAANEMNIYSSATTHVVIDAYGYYTAATPTTPAPTLACSRTAAGAASLAFGFAQAQAPACGAGTVATSTECTASSPDITFSTMADGTCAAYNAGPSATIEARRVCCALQGN